MTDHKIKIYFGNELANLHELGWISTNLSQLLEFSELLESGKADQAEKLFGNKARPFNRYTPVAELKDDKPRIIDVQNGSIELVIAGASLTASVIMPLVQIAVQRYFRKEDENITFQLSPQDKGLSNIMTAYEKGEFGEDNEGFVLLISVLKERNYNVDYLAENTYLIEHVVDKYAQRIIRTIKKNQ